MSKLGGKIAIVTGGASGGWPYSRRWAHSSALIGRVGRLGDVARLVLCLASDEFSLMTGRTLFIDGGMRPKKYAELFGYFCLLAGEQAQARREQARRQVNDLRALPQGLAQLAIGEPRSGHQQCCLPPWLLHTNLLPS